MNFQGNYFLILARVSDTAGNMKYAKAVFWILTIAIIVQAIAPINGVNSKLNQTFIFSMRLDYLTHIAMFSCLSALFRLAYFPQAGFVPVNELVFFSVMLFTAFFSEAIQLLVGYRAFNINDLIANFLGILCSVPLVGARRFFINNRRKYLQSGVN